MRIANSSPPSRAATSPSRRQPRMRSLTITSSSSPAAWPRVSLTALKSSRSSRRMTGRTPSRPRHADPQRRRLGERDAVRQPGQGVVVGLVAELLLESRQLRQRLLELAVLECHGRLVGDRLQQEQVVASERRPLRQPIRHGQHADDPRLADERRDHRLTDRHLAAAGVRRADEPGAMRLQQPVERPARA